ncbi:MAG: ImmA/IrrE family metallo-endopeptidase [Acetobacter fabarum]|jgi:Zn-dependent peptidase ImmA (M78 family)|uniref:ImmA/IrrE family metallo-endopeptidase n=1 Tax=Acetobacter fabarum TaxID=483199 RepID=UPI00242CF000|nr:ImmA/IrrE family metallo-endopeptidase [Acetobacter fabarum]MCH4025249.1 ImmA/IrrE family metallo-endopeptidase [Acetobacter fabarum]MCH4055103.1 ImmA/IrrE family metallo-endopeptidase [Acetobacter fabarum]MCH4128888.1 ImmA/IrrE family metallo-endopeptidase [Acetobacter fabarum]MCH4142077.1 ImmA/IrrE family metallo-endopeptidase [Acetobacter fabarum]MCI1393800.1 ImmA/IrrE family metallo-endopeptidase [Acetobacter fabarum]
MPDYDRAIREANRLVARYYFETPPVDPEIIAEGEGVDVLYARFKPAVSNNLSGYLDIKSREIVVNKEISPTRKIFTIAHELGHFILHQDYAASQNYLTLPRRDDYADRKPDVEKEADVFAANLLMPETMVRKYMEVASIPEMARMFAVSDAAMRHRVSQLSRVRTGWWRR